MSDWSLWTRCPCTISPLWPHLSFNAFLTHLAEAFGVIGRHLLSLLGVTNTRTHDPASLDATAHQGY
eukprot:6460533-Karenia_brevis.AAC.1